MNSDRKDYVHLINTLLTDSRNQLIIFLSILFIRFANPSPKPIRKSGNKILGNCLAMMGELPNFDILRGESPVKYQNSGI
jgi:hypothetical protein